MSRLRTFLALDLGPALRQRCLDLQTALAREVDGVRWVEPENLHVTLLFLGEVDEREIAEVCRAATRVGMATAAFTLELRGVGCFPHPRRPRVVWAGLAAGRAETVALHDALELELLELGCYRREERQYTPHVTLGRVKGERAVASLAPQMDRHAGWSGGAVAVRELLILSSELGRDGSRYTVLGRAALHAGPASPARS
jgi:2'-5' RNA ligase